MVLGFRQVDRIGLAGDQADQAFVRAQHGLVHGLLVEAFGGVELERAVHAQHVDRADLRHHVGGDQHHDLVQALLRADLLRHHLAKPAQQHARTAERATHDVIPRVSPSGRAARPRLEESQETVATGPRRPQRLPSITPYSECSVARASQSVEADILPGITRRNATAGRAEFVAVDQRGVDVAQARGRGQLQHSLDTVAFGPNNRSTARSKSFAAAGCSSTEGAISPVRSSIRRSRSSSGRRVMAAPAKRLARR